MKLEPEMILKKIASNYQLDVKYTRDLPDRCGGFLYLHDAHSFIAVNANHPHFEQLFTIAHELMHYIRHVPQRCSIPLPKYILRDWKFPFLNRIRKLTIRVTQCWFSRELEANTLAIGILSAIGAKDEVRQWIRSHPECSDAVFVMAGGTLLGLFKRVLVFNILQRKSLRSL